MVFFDQDDDTIMREPSTRGYLLVAAAAGLWGTLGLLFRALHDTFGLAALTIAFLRAGTAFTILIVVLAIVRPRLLKVPLRALPFFAIYGFCGVTAFYFSYTQAVIQTTVTTAVVLLYTAPAFVTLIAWRVWGEPLGARKITALVLAFVGCALVARAYDPARLGLDVIGLGFGLAAGFTYALYTVFSKSALERFSVWTALTYALLFGALFLAPLQMPESFAPLLQPGAWLFLLALAVGPTLGSLALYSAGILRVPASNASLVATIEPVVASSLAFLFLGERLELLQMVGGAMVVAGAVWLSFVG
ncbi:MAG: EamA family transporter [Chloroflexota bacterium]|nr:EamA family transporter [Chloroflexota bacterium]